MGQVKADKLKEDIAGVEANIEKTKALITKHQTQLEKMIAKDKTDYRIRSKKENIENAKRKLARYEERLAELKVKLQQEQDIIDLIEREAPKVLIDFTYAWKELAIDWHLHQIKEYIRIRADLRKRQNKLILDTIKTIPEYQTRYFDENGEPKTDWIEGGSYYIKRHKEVHPVLVENELDDKRIEYKLALRKNSLTDTLARMRTTEERKKFIEGRMERERIAKLEDLFFRIYDVTGKIVDGSRLDVSEKGNLDGIITGEKATVRVNTIGAGGYNIQCFHYRTLVHAI